MFRTLGQEPSRKEKKIMRRVFQKEARKELERIQMNMIAHKPRWLPRFLWGRIVAIVLKSADDRARE